MSHRSVDSAGASVASRTLIPLLERETECEVLAGAVREAQGGRGSLTVVEGPAGIGKSRLLHEVAEMVDGTGMHVLDARGTELEDRFPYGIVLQLFERSLQEATPDQRKEWLSGPAAVLAPLLLSGDVLQGSRSLPAMAHGLLWLATNMAAPSLLVLVDDVQWADPPSLTTLAYLRPRLADLPIAVIVSARLDDTSSRAVAYLGAQTHVRPLPLSPGAVRSVVRYRLDGATEEFCRACGSISDGNPFLLQALVSEAAEAGMVGEAQEVLRVGALAPALVLQAVLSRLGGLPDGAGALARAIAVLGDGCGLAQAARLAKIALPKATAAADAMARADILRPGAPLGFAHPLIGAVVEADIAPHAAADAHRKAARLLAADGWPAERLVAHLLLATAAGDPWVVQMLRRGATVSMAQGVPDVAMAALRRALDEPPLAEERAEVLVEFGVAQAAAGAPEAPATLTEAITLLDDPHRRGEVSRFLAAALGGQGRHREAAGWLERAISELDDDGDNLRRELHAAFLSVALLDVNTAPGAVALGGRIRNQIGTHTPGERALLGHLAVHRAFSGDSRDEVTALARLAWADGQLLADQGPDGDTWDKVTAAYTWTWDTEPAVRICDAIIDEARARGSEMAFATASMCRSLPLLLQGHVLAAVADAESAVAAIADGWNRYPSLANALLGLALLERGEIDEAERAIDIASDAKHKETMEYLATLVARGRLRLLQGRPADALADHMSAQSLWTAFGMQAPIAVVWSWRPGAALAAAQLGDRNQALLFMEAETAAASRVGCAEGIGRALRLSGIIEGGSQGLDRLIEAVAMLAKTAARLEHAEALLDLGVAMRRSSRRKDARRLLTDGAELAHALGATRLEERAMQELVLAGVRSRRPGVTGRAALTASEMRVAELANKGLANRQIAQALFVTTKAIEWHLANAYRKLGIRSRAGLAEAMGTDGPPVSGTPPPSG